MAAPLLVTGATGRLGRAVVAGLLARGQRVRVLTRHGMQAQALCGTAVEIAEGAFEDATSLQRALQGVRRVFLLSPIGPTLAEQQGALIQAAQATGSVQRIVKLSGSDWTIQPPGRSAAGEAHLAVEQRLAASGIGHAVLRPNAWMQVALARLGDELRQGSDIRAVFGDAAVAYIHLQDIADVAVAVLLADAPPPRPLVLTGPRAVTHEQLAAISNRLLGRPVRSRALSLEEQARSPGEATLPPFVRLAHAQFGQLIRSGAAAGVTDSVAQLLGRPARTVEDFLETLLKQPATTST